MLSERRVKQRLVPDPRNKSWATDESSFGHKLLSKMGWSKGKGLGKSEQGIDTSEKLQSKPNVDSRGFGSTKKDVEGWQEGGNAFDSLLARLNAQSALSNKGSLEIKEKKTVDRTLKGRARYRTTKAKDASLYSSHDLNCILGRRKPVHEKDNVLAKRTRLHEHGEDS